MRFLAILLFSFCSLVIAEHEEETKNQVDSGSSKSKVEPLNKAVEVIRDPTAMSHNFRRALQGISSQSNNIETGVKKDDGTTLRALGIPEIELVAKVFNSDGTGTVVLRANGKIFHFEEGDQISRVIDDQIVTLHVQEISKNTVRLLIMPFNKYLIF